MKNKISPMETSAFLFLVIKTESLIGGESMKYFLIGLAVMIFLPVIVLVLGAAGFVITLTWQVFIYGVAIFLLLVAIGWLIASIFGWDK